MEFSIANLQPKERASFALRALYEAAGCRKYHMGRFEEYSLYQANRSFLSSEQVITFTDLDGRLLALKPDVTLSIAKTAQPAPGETLRYYYHENVYRPSAESHTFKEISQMGLEMLGAVGEAQVQQAVCLAARSLDALGADWVLEVSHMGYLFGLFDALGVPDAARAKLLEKLREKNAHELRAAAGAAGLADAADTLCSVLNLCGSYADTLAKAAALCRNDAMRAAVAELEALAVPLEKAGGVIRLDMTLAGEMEYYNGLVFQGYLKALPRPLLKGGRYDLLMQKFTPGAGAIGFAVYLDELDRLSAPLPPVQKNSTDKVMLNVALPKGRLGDRMYDLLARIGYGCTEDYNATRKLVVEITEQEDLDRACLERKRNVPGFSGSFALDDYGSGYSNGSSLLTIAPRYVKVDISIIRGIDTNTDKQQFLTSLVDYARPRNILVLAEGVETTAELRKVLELGVDLLQGYCLARPAAVPPPLSKEAADIIHRMKRC